MDQPAPAYRGDQPYVFVCYAHQDKALVYPQITWLHEQGVNIWYDEGISPGEEWSEELGWAIENAERFLFFVTPAAVASRHCRDEVHFAKNHETQILAVHLEETALPVGIELAIGSNQAISAHAQPKAEWQRRLLEALQVEDMPVPQAVQASGPSDSRLKYGWAAGLIVVLAGLYWGYLLPDAEFGGSQTLDLSISMATPRVVGDDASAQIVSENVADNLATLLTQYPEIRFVASAGGEDTGGANYRLTTNVRSLKGQIGVGLRLARISNGQSVWSESFRIAAEPTEADVAQTATTMGRFLRFEMAKDAQCEVVRQRSRSAEAADLYCFALTQWQRVNRGDAIDVGLMISAAEKALKLDPNLGEAYVFVVTDKIWASTVFGAMSVEEASRAAHVAADKGLSLKPDDIPLLYIRAFVEAVLDLDLDVAEATARRALSIDPFHPYAQEHHGLLGKIALYRNDVVAALEHYRRAIQIFDTDAETFMEYANTLRIAGRHREAIESAQAAVELDHAGPIRMMAIYTLASTYVALGETEKAAAAADYVTLADKSDWAGLYVAILATGGHIAEAQSVRQRLEESGARIIPLQGFLYSVAQGQDEKAFDWLHQGIDERSPYLIEYLGVDPRYETLRRDERWKDVVAHLDAERERLE